MISEIISEIAKKLSEVESGNPNLSIRKNDLWRYKRADDNIFAFSSTLFILQKYQGFLNSEELRIFEKIESQILAFYPKYQNKDGRLTYNFYRTKPSGHFPNGKLMRRLDHFRLPDDIDDTALIYLTSDYTKEQTLWLQNHLADFTDQFGDSKSRIYGTWFGKNMPKEQDVCALLNLMCLFFKHNLELNDTDKNTLDYLGSSINEIVTNPFKIARHYGHPALIIYHYARFMGEYSHKKLDAKKSQLIEISKELLLKEKNKLFRILLETSLLQFGEIRESIELDLTLDHHFYSFIGAPLAPFQNPALRFISQNRWLQIFWKSEIHELALVLEYACLSKKQGII